MKVIQINVTCTWGSTGRIAEEIGQLVISNKGESYIAFGREHNKSKLQLLTIGNKIDIYWQLLIIVIYSCCVLYRMLYNFLLCLK